MKWETEQPLKSEALIDEFEKLRDYTFPKSFREWVLLYNGGAPEDGDVFDTEETEERVFGFLCSFNKEDEGLTVWDVVEAYEENMSVAREYEDFEDLEAYEKLFNRYVVFADTPFGDDIAFDKTDDSVVFIDHETFMVEKIADSFDEFVACLYESEPDDEY